MNIYRHHIGDYRSATTHLTNEEDLCYRRIIEVYYDRDGELPDIPMLARKVRMTKETVETILGEFFTLTDGGWKHARADLEITAYRERSEAASRSGKASAAARSSNERSTVAEPPLNDSSTVAEPTSTNQEPITKNQYIPPTPQGGVGEVVGGFVEAFEEFWKAYPESRKKNRYRTEQAWSAQRHILPPISEILASLEAFKHSKEWKQDDGKLIPYPWNWIQERRWTDAPAYSAPKSKPKHEVDEAEAFRWRSTAYPESLEVHPTAATFPFRAWPESIRKEYLTRK